MTAALVRIFAASLLCMALLNLSEGPMREVLRLGCAALMVHTVITVCTQMLPGFDLTGRIDGAVTEAVLQAQINAAETQRTLVSDALSLYIAQQGRAAGGVCTGTVTYRVDQDGVCTLVSAQVLWQSGSEEAKAVLRQALSHDFGLPEEQICIQEVTP